MQQIALCMGDKESTGQLQDILHRWVQMSCADVAVREYETAQALLKGMETEKVLFLFLGTELSDMTGLDAAYRIRGSGPDCQIAFISEKQSYALPCYEVHPAGFFLKPVQETKIRELLHWNRSMFLPYFRFLCVISDRIPLKLLLADIQYVEVSGRTSLIHMKNETVSTNKSLSALENELKGEVFIRTHRAYIVNYTHIVGIEKTEVILRSGQRVPVSEDRFNSVSKTLRDQGTIQRR